MDTITYNGKEYPIRTFEVRHEYTGDNTTTCTIGVDSLWDALSEHGEGEHVDNEIYHYIPDEELNLDAEFICRGLLDIPMEFVSEL